MTAPPPIPGLDDDAVFAVVELGARMGGRAFEIGFLRDGVPVAEAGWWAKVQFRGAVIMVEEQPGPDVCADALAARLLTGAKCQNCAGLVTLSADGSAFVFTRATLADGSRWDARQAAAAPRCQWRRVGPRWIRSCSDAGAPERDGGAS